MEDGFWLCNTALELNYKLISHWNEIHFWHWYSDVFRESLELLALAFKQGKQSDCCKMWNKTSPACLRCNCCKPHSWSLQPIQPPYLTMPRVFPLHDFEESVACWIDLIVICVQCSFLTCFLHWWIASRESPLYLHNIHVTCLFALFDSGLIAKMHTWLQKGDKPITQILRFMVS